MRVSLTVDDSMNEKSSLELLILAKLARFCSSSCLVCSLFDD